MCSSSDCCVLCHAGVHKSSLPRSTLKQLPCDGKELTQLNTSTRMCFPRRWSLLCGCHQVLSTVMTSTVKVNLLTVNLCQQLSVDSNVRLLVGCWR